MSQQERVGWRDGPVYCLGTSCNSHHLFCTRRWRTRSPHLLLLLFCHRQSICIWVSGYHYFSTFFLCEPQGQLLVEKEIKPQEQINPQSFSLHTTYIKRYIGLLHRSNRAESQVPLFSSSICFTTVSQPNRGMFMENWWSRKKYQHRFSFFRIWAFDSREVRIRIFLFGYRNRGLKAKRFESQLHVVVSNAMERGVNKLQIGLHIQLPEKEKRIQEDFSCLTRLLWCGKAKANTVTPCAVLLISAFISKKEWVKSAHLD